MLSTPRPEPFHIMVKPRGPVCNLDCAYCFYLRKDSLYPAGEDFNLSPECLETFIRDYIAAQPGPEITFAWQGGEPTLMGLDFFRKAIELQKRYLPQGWRASHSFQTNGTLLDDEWCEFFKANSFLIGISMDGPDHIHDFYRHDKGGGPTHTRVVRAVKLLQKHGVDYNILCVVNNVNAAQPLEAYRYFRELGVDWMQFIPIVEREGSGVSSRSVSPLAYGKFLTAIFDEWIRNDVGKIFVQIFEESVAAWAGYQPSLCIFRETCGRALIMEHNGDLYACDHFVDPPYKVGNILQKNMVELVNSLKQRQFGLDKRDKLPRQCRECDVQFICHGACPKDRFINTVDGEPGLNYLCEGYRHFFHHADPMLRRIAAIVRQRQPATIIMDQLRAEEEQKWTATKRNDPCPCGSGQKYKKCCLPKRESHTA